MKKILNLYSTGLQVDKRHCAPIFDRLSCQLAIVHCRTSSSRQHADVRSCRVLTSEGLQTHRYQCYRRRRHGSPVASTQWSWAASWLNIICQQTVGRTHLLTYQVLSYEAKQVMTLNQCIPLRQHAVWHGCRQVWHDGKINWVKCKVWKHSKNFEMAFSGATIKYNPK